MKACIVTGARDFGDEKLVRQVLTQVNPGVVIHGACGRDGFNYDHNALITTYQSTSTGRGSDNGAPRKVWCVGWSRDEGESERGAPRWCATYRGHPPKEDMGNQPTAWAGPFSFLGRQRRGFPRARNA